MLIQAKALILLGLVAIVFGGGWTVNGWRLSGQHAQELAKRDREALAMAEAVKEIGIRSNEIISQADAKGVKGIQDAKAETARLRKCIADGSCSVRLKTDNPEQQSASLDAASSLGNAASGISPSTAGRVLNLWDAVESDAAKLGYLQAYADTCYRAGVEAARVKAN